MVDVFQPAAAAVFARVALELLRTWRADRALSHLQRRSREWQRVTGVGRRVLLICCLCCLARDIWPSGHTQILVLSGQNEQRRWGERGIEAFKYEY